MKFIVEQGFDIKEGKAQEFRAWLTEHEAKLAKESPAGVEY